MTYELSVIIPVFNDAKYAEEGLLSLIEQTIFSKMEIIVIDDGSTDNSKKIIADFSNKYKNIKYLYQKNQGVSIARNKGLDIASGKFIGFFDIDDLVEQDYFEKMLNYQKKYDSDITISDFEMDFLDGTQKKHRIPQKKYWNNNIQMLKDFFSGNYIGNNVVDKIFKATVVRNIRFPANYAIGEDMYFVYEAIKAADNMYMDSKYTGYHYRIHNGSVMNSSFGAKYFDAVKLSEKMIQKSTGDLKLYAQVHLVHEECKLLENMLKNNGVLSNYQQYKVYRKKIKEFKLYKAYKFLNKRQFLGLMIMRFSPKLYMKIHDLMKIG